MTTTALPPHHPLLPAAALVRDRVLLRGTSLCRARDRCWRAPAIDALRARVAAAAAAPGPSTWGDRWEAVLAGADDGTLQLAGEAVAVHVLIAADLTGATKRSLVHGAFARMLAPAALSPVVEAALDAGATRTGIAFKRRRLSQLAFLLEAAAAWRRLPGRRRAEGLADPSAFREWLWTVPVSGGQPQREALLHLAHPGTFEPIVSRTAKERIVAALGLVEETTGDTDADLAAIRRRLTPVHGEGFSFGDPALSARWR